MGSREKPCVYLHVSFGTKQSTVSIICSIQHENANMNLDKLGSIRNERFFIRLYSFHRTCIFQYMTTVMSVFIVLF